MISPGLNVAFSMRSLLYKRLASEMRGKRAEDGTGGACLRNRAALGDELLVRLAEDGRRRADLEDALPEPGREAVDVAVEVGVDRAGVAVDDERGAGVVDRQDLLLDD